MLHTQENEHGLLEGLVVDEMIIQKEKEQVVKKGAVIALYKGKLSKNGDFQMILNHSLMFSSSLSNGGGSTSEPPI